MGIALLAGAFGLLGAIIGSAATLAVNWMSLRAEGRQGQIARQTAIRDRQYEAHLDFLNRGASFQDIAREMVYACAGGAQAEECERLKALTDLAFANLSDRAGAAQLAGPNSLAGAVADLNRQYKIYRNYLNKAYGATKSEDKASALKRCRAQTNAVFRNRVAYLTLAQQFFDRP
ncbi:MAG: hypothetical protein K2Y33_13040 [Mycolicibacterium frederiksbergense]|uniref:hypothetical protein n=1 Tax=Mycobacterium adipatum TaxID=1682113 RepID=UPI0027ED7DCA|nr:hypothetical protein [Mycolicibacterium frederiksbergense]